MSRLNSSRTSLSRLSGPGSFSIADAFENLMDKPWLPRSWLVRLYPRDVDTSTDPPTILTPPGTTIEGIHLSTDGHKTLETDSITLQFREAVIDPYSLTYEIKNGLWGVVSASEGVIRLANADNKLNFMLRHDFEGRAVDVLVGPQNGSFVQFATVGELLSRSILHNRDTISVSVDDKSFLFDKRIQSTLYLGTGSLEGDEAIKGKPKPLLFGEVPRLEPVLVTGGSSFIYQVNDGAWEAAGGVEDKGISLAFDADVADITTATPASGEFSTSLATGYIKLGSKPNGTVIVTNAKGHNSSTYGYVDAISGLIRLLITEFGGLSDPADLDLIEFVNLESFTAKMGHWTGLEQESIADVMRVFFDAALAWGWLKPNNIYTTGRITDPDLLTPDVVLGQQNDIKLSPWSMDHWERTPARIRVGYARYFKTLNASDLASTVTDEFQQDVKEEYRFVSNATGTAAKFIQTPLAQELTILTQLTEESDAQAIADEQFALRNPLRRKGIISPLKGLIKIGIGSIIELTDDRQHVGVKNWVVVGVKNSAARQNSDDVVEWTVFG